MHIEEAVILFGCADNDYTGILGREKYLTVQSWAEAIVSLTLLIKRLPHTHTHKQNRVFHFLFLASS